MAKKRVQDDGHITREFINNADGTFSMNIKCSKCGEPISVANEFGMFCKNLCGLEESKKIMLVIDKLLKLFSDES